MEDYTIEDRLQMAFDQFEVLKDNISMLYYDMLQEEDFHKKRERYVEYCFPERFKDLKKELRDIQLTLYPDI